MATCRSCLTCDPKSSYTFLTQQCSGREQRCTCREHHTAHAHARTALHWHAVGLVFFVLSILIYRIVDIDSCETRYVSWLGYLPMHLIFTPAVAWTLSCNCPVDGHSRSRAVQV